MAETGGDRGNGGGDGLGLLWVLVPMTALLIPISAVADSVVPVVMIAFVMLAIVAGLVGRSFMDRRHQHRLELLDAEARVAREERLGLSEANRIIDRNTGAQTDAAAVAELRDVVRAEPPGVTSEPAREVDGA